MLSFRFKSVCIEAFGLNFPEAEVSSSEIEDRLAPLYQRLQIPFGTLEKLSGVKTRYLWDKKVAPSQVATVAAQRALDEIGFDRDQIGAVFSCSVTRDYFEPATACLIHRNLGIKETSLAMDISDACIGFSDGLLMMANLIETGVVKSGVVVSGENISIVIEASIKHIMNDPSSISRDQLLKILPTFTLGCGAVAYVLCHESIATKKHRLVGAACRSATQFSDLCEGNGDYYILQETDLNPIMSTESSKLIPTAAKLGGRTWPDASAALGWSREEIDHIFCHQVGKQVNEAFYRDMGLDMEKEYTIYKKYGNMVSAALPSALVLGAEEKQIKSGEKVLLTAFGSGLNCRFLGIVW